MNVKTIFKRALLCVLCLAVLLASLISCSAPLDDDETPPEQMRCASIAGAPYRLYLPSLLSGMCLRKKTHRQTHQQKADSSQRRRTSV